MAGLFPLLLNALILTRDYFFLRREVVLRLLVDLRLVAVLRRAVFFLAVLRLAGLRLVVLLRLAVLRAGFFLAVLLRLVAALRRVVRLRGVALLVLRFLAGMETTSFLKCEFEGHDVTMFKQSHVKKVKLM